MGGRIDKAECRALRADGWSLERLSERYGVTKPAVSLACRGIKCPVDRSRYGVQKIQRARAEDVAKQRSLVRSLFAEGFYPKQIAFDTGLTLAVVYYHLPPIKSPSAQQLRASGAEGARPCA